MKIFTGAQVREADQYTIKNEPIKSIDLMERAAQGLADKICKQYEKTVEMVFFAGIGNNGGDAWALARLLWKAGYKQIRFFQLDLKKNLSADSQVNKKRLKTETSVPVIEISNHDDFPHIKPDEIVIDGLFGSGVNRKLEGLPAELVKHINVQAPKEIIAIDLPSGLMGEDNKANSYGHIINATKTYSFQFPKLAFFFAENNPKVGHWEVIDIKLHEQFITEEQTPYHYTTNENIKKTLKPRDVFTHKGTYGHALIIAGSYGMMGASVLATKAALRAGVGLATAHVPAKCVDIIQISIPETLIDIDESEYMFTGVHQLNKYTSICLGPGINTKPNTQRALYEVLQNYESSVVLDADALNILALSPSWENRIRPGTILTPHPKEFDRLFGESKTSFDRIQKQREFSIKSKSIVVLKGANTSISDDEGNIYFNSSGNPGMATGGSGDVLAGIIAGLTAQNYTPKEAAILGVYVHGLAADIVAEKMGMQALLPSDIIDNIGCALKHFE